LGLEQKSGNKQGVMTRKWSGLYQPESYEGFFFISIFLGYIGLFGLPEVEITNSDLNLKFALR
jgi:hypothetical protein